MFKTGDDGNVCPSVILAQVFLHVVSYMRQCTL
jgi:hypothetical protein